MGLLGAKAVDVESAVPKTGAIIIRTSAQLVKNAQAGKAAFDYIETVMSEPVQKDLEATPWVMMPTNRKVKLTGPNLKLASGVDELIAKNRLLDWTNFQHLRGEWITRFTKGSENLTNDPSVVIAAESGRSSNQWRCG